MHLGQHHQFLRRRGIIPSMRHKLAVRLMDIFAYVASSFSIFFTVDQVRIIWIEQNVTGVSLLSWTFYTISASTWFLYGYVHKDRVLMITNSVWLLCTISIVSGILLYQ